MTDRARPPAEIRIDESLARSLLQAQARHMATAELTFVDEGWDNVTYRVGSDLALRVPRRRIAAELLTHEQRWLPEIARRLPVPVPVPVVAGEPTDRFPWPWSVVRWIAGATADREPLGPTEHEALTAALHHLHRRAPGTAPRSPLRGVPLSERDEIVGGRLQDLALDRYRKLWEAALDAPPPARTVWIHGDLHPRNLITRGGRLAGILDWGDLGAGDRATDLCCTWLLFDTPDARKTFLASCGASRTETLRAAGWALNWSTAVLASGDRVHAPMGEQATERLAEDFGSLVGS